MKKTLLTILQISVLYGIYYVGSFIQALLDLTIPGSIIGMLGLFILLQFKIVKEKWLSEGSQFLLSRLPLLFLPATVGVIEYIPFFQGKGILTVLIVLISTFLVMVISGAVGQYISKKKEQREEYERSLDA
ncbi:CidA/LrgA family holin-like protein [Cytobacillus sp. S13-E01]|uniref:CidA/LrgA family protein n=1 Tax=Cytobacillus sp. S13-E01 TaxID=3031326 RepID=UPI0023D84FBF|nr:CidA/LrgA family holin-like protein [Cytobacillus sp. S13-E01]MDF0726478.1 CidA/LrgA family holin-like protein [Cytobacillus sp. S13-E01]